MKYIITIFSGSTKGYFYNKFAWKQFDEIRITFELTKAHLFNTEAEAVAFIEELSKAPAANSCAFGVEEYTPKSKTLWDTIKDMSKEEFAKWLYANCEWISAEYGSCSGANDELSILELLNTAEDNL